MKTAKKAAATKKVVKMKHHYRELHRDHDDPVAEALRLAQNGTARLSGVCAERETRPYASFYPY